MAKDINKKLFDEAKKFLVGGVNSPVRAFKAVGTTPLFIKRAKGAYIYDEEGNKFIDYVLSWGPMILGHADNRVISAVSKVLKNGASFGAPTKRETELAKLVTQIYPSIEKLRLTSSGTEAAMSAVRLARGFTGRRKIIKFEGCYHGHADILIGNSEDTIILPFNDIERLEGAVKKQKEDIACVIVEPVAANMGVVLPKENFLERLRRITKENDILLIFDEVITGFRVALGGAQQIYNIRPDITILGKILGGGLPAAGFGARHDIMAHLAPEGPVYQAGTLSGNPVVVQAGITTIKALMQKGIYQQLEQKAAQLEAGIKESIEKKSAEVTLNRAGSLFTLFFTKKREINNYSDAGACDLQAYARFFRRMLSQGVYLAASQFEANFISLKHTSRDIGYTIKAAARALDSGSI